jgi:hypothetical protein
VAQGVDQARQQRELIKEQLASDAARIEARIRGELDWRSRLRRDGPRLLALGAGAVLLIGTIVLVRARVRRHPQEEPAAAASLDDVARELREIRARLERRGGGDAGPVWQKALLRGVAAAGAAGGTYAAKRMMDQQTGRGKGRAEATGVS